MSHQSISGTAVVVTPELVLGDGADSVGVHGGDVDGCAVLLAEGDGLALGGGDEGSLDLVEVAVLGVCHLSASGDLDHLDVHDVVVVGRGPGLVGLLEEDATGLASGLHGSLGDVPAAREGAEGGGQDLERTVVLLHGLCHSRRGAGGGAGGCRTFTTQAPDFFRGCQMPDARRPMPDVRRGRPPGARRGRPAGGGRRARTAPCGDRPGSSQ